MTWTSACSGAPEYFLDKAWDSANQSLSNSSVSLAVRHRITACVRDAITFAGILRELHASQVTGFEAAHARQSCMSSDELALDWRRHSDEPMRTSHRYAASMRAMYFFIRALQDALYGAFLEMDGTRTGDHVSMHKCAVQPKHPVNKLIARELPNYFEWFGRHRQVRNRMKLGVGVGAQFSFGVRERQVRVNLYRVIEQPREAIIDGDLAIEDVEECFVQSAALLTLLDTTIRGQSSLAV